MQHQPPFREKTEQNRSPERRFHELPLVQQYVQQKSSCDRAADCRKNHRKRIISKREQGHYTNENRVEGKVSGIVGLWQIFMKRMVRRNYIKGLRDIHVKRPVIMPVDER